MKINYSELKTAAGEPYDPEKHFIRKRNGKLFVYDKQIHNWRWRHKKHGCLKNSKHTNNTKWLREQFLKKMGYTG